MKPLQICMIAVCCTLLTGTAAGYLISFTTEPSETMPGGIVTIAGTSNLPAGYTDEAILYRQLPNALPKEVGRYSFTTTVGGDWGFVIDTTGFLPAIYKVQLPKSAEYPYGSSAVLMRTFEVTPPPETQTVATTPPTIQTTVTQPITPEPPGVSPEPTGTPLATGTVVIATGFCALLCMRHYGCTR